MKRSIRIFSALVFLCSCLFLLLPGNGAEADADFDQVAAPRLLCLNIGKADCMLLFSDGKTYLIDAGYEHTWPALEMALSEFGVTHLDGVFLTHVHQDHEGGLMALSESSITVDAWYASEIYYDVKPNKHPMYQAAASRGEDVVWLSAGDTISLSDTSYFQIIGPLSINTDNENNNSLVMKFTSSHGSILFAGDMKEEEEYELLLSGSLSQCDLLKVGHHGDNKATTQVFLNTVRPSVAYISTSTVEEPDTPAPETLKRLQAIGADIYISQEGRDAHLFTLEKGNVAAEDITWTNVGPAVAGLKIEMDLEKDALTIHNTSDTPVQLSGAYLYSSKGNDVFSLPDITILANGSYMIGSGDTPYACDHIAQKKRIWHKSKRDVALLYDAYGRIISGTDNGIEE